MSGKENIYQLSEAEKKIIEAYRICPYDVILRSDYVATTVWTRQDISCRLEELGYTGSEEEVDAVLKTGYLKNLGSWTDEDWQMIDEAINEAALKSEDECSREDNEDE